MREYIAYKIMREMGLDVPECAYSHITVNGEEWGLYLAVDPVDEVFLAEHFADATGDLYKPEGMGYTGADLVYNGDDISAYTGLNLKTNLNSSDGKEILALMQALEDGEGLEEVLDVEKALKYIAANVALANFDSYLGNTTHNFYLYEENGRFTIIPWDMNLAFGGFGGGEVDIYEPTKQGMGGFGGGDKRKDTQDNDAVTNAAENTEAQADANNQPQPHDNADMQGMPSMGSGEKPLVTTLLENETYRSMYEGYLKEIAEKYFTQEYMTELVTKIHDLIAPYVQNDPTAFCTYEEFEQACSTDPTDQYSLVYYAVNMAESIENQLNGGEPTFNTSSMQGGPDFGGEKPDMPSRTEQTTDAQQNAQQNDRPTPPDQNGGQQGGQMDENERSGQQSGQQNGQQGSPPDFGGGEKNPPGMPGQDNKSVHLSDCLPTIAVCGGVFVVGVVVLILFKRKKDLKPPKENKTE